MADLEYLLPNTLVKCADFHLNTVRVPFVCFSVLTPRFKRRRQEKENNYLSQRGRGECPPFPWDITQLGYVQLTRIPLRRLPYHSSFL